MVTHNSKALLCKNAEGDVDIQEDAVTALLDLLLRDSTVGASCGRVHPKGSGLMYWYQRFEYAIGHWFQKTAEDVLGSVLCCPGISDCCFCSTIKRRQAALACSVLVLWMAYLNSIPQ